MNRIKPNEIILNSFEGFPNIPLLVLRYQEILKELEKKPSEEVEELFYSRNWQTLGSMEYMRLSIFIRQLMKCSL